MEHSRLTRAKRLSEVERDLKKARLLRWGLYLAIVLAAAGAIFLVGRHVFQGMQARDEGEKKLLVADLIDSAPAMFGGDRQSIHARLGEPERVDDSVVKDNRKRGAGWEQIIYRVHYSGLVIEIQRLRKKGEPERETLSQITLTSSAYKLRHELGVGMYKSRVRSILGAPTREEPDKDIYEVSEVFQKQIRFLYTGEIVTSIEWRF